MGDPISMIGIGATVGKGVLGAMGSMNKAEGDKIAIQGQMLSAMGKAFQYDVEAQQFMWKSGLEKYQMAVSKLNQDIAKENATYARSKGEQDAQQKGMEVKFNLGNLIASQGASGISVAGGSSARVREGMLEVGYHDQATIRANAARQAYGYDVTAMQHEAEAAIHSMTSEFDVAQAENATTAAGIVRKSMPLLEQAQGLAQTSGMINAAASLTGAAGSVASKWTEGSFKGMFGDKSDAG